MSSDLIERLRANKLMIETVDVEARRYEYHDTDLAKRAAAALKAKDREIERLREALRSAIAHRYGEWTAILEAALAKGEGK